MSTYSFENKHFNDFKDVGRLNSNILERIFFITYSVIGVEGKYIIHIYTELSQIEKNVRMSLLRNNIFYCIHTTWSGDAIMTLNQLMPYTWSISEIFSSYFGRIWNQWNNRTSVLWIIIRNWVTGCYMDALISTLIFTPFPLGRNNYTRWDPKVTRIVFCVTSP